MGRTSRDPASASSRSAMHQNTVYPSTAKNRGKGTNPGFLSPFWRIESPVSRACHHNALQPACKKQYTHGKGRKHLDDGALEQGINEGCDPGGLPKNQQHPHQEDGEGERNQPPQLALPQESEKLTHRTQAQPKRLD